MALLHSPIHVCHNTQPLCAEIMLSQALSRQCQNIFVTLYELCIQPGFNVYYEKEAL